MNCTMKILIQPYIKYVAKQHNEGELNESFNNAIEEFEIREKERL